MKSHASQPCVVRITGHPATGKSTLGQKLADRYSLPLITKDAIKERIFDTLGYSDKAWSLKVSAASHRIIDFLLKQELATGHSLIVESNFKRSIDDDRFRRVRDAYPSTWIQILCWADGNVLFERYMTRQQSSERHPGHAESATQEETRAAFANGRAEILDMPDMTLELDTTDLRGIDYAEILRRLDGIVQQTRSDKGKR